MTEWKLKRFWTEVGIEDGAEGCAVTLDGRPVRTPAKTRLVLPTRAFAEAVAEEWRAQEGEIDPRTMPATRAANAALDKIAHQRDDVIALLAAYGDSDLLCYRAAEPAGLVARQAEGWDPLLDWAAEVHEARLRVTTGILPVAQPPEALARLAQPLHGMNAFQLAGAHDLIALSGSLVLALAVIGDRLEPATAWALSRIDEDWQTQEWGVDEEAAEVAALKADAFLAAARHYRLATA